MRVLGVVTLVSPHGEYGGPLRVAVNQLRALAERGHTVVLAGAHRGYREGVPTEIEGVPARLYPARTVVPGIGFAGISAPGLLAALRYHAHEFDVVHLHAARDLVTLPAARIVQRRGVATVLQTHGMIDESEHALARPLDRLLTVPALTAALAVTYLTPHERRSLEVVGGGNASLVELANGVPESGASRTATSTPEVLYLARLAPRKHPELFVRAAIALLETGGAGRARFSLVGPDEGAAADAERLISRSQHGDRVRWEGAIPPDQTIARMREASVYVLPSVDEPYPMSVLEAMSVGLPVIVTDTCGLARFVRENHAGIVVPPRYESLADAIGQILADPAAAAQMGERGRRAVVEHRSMAAVARTLEDIYRRNPFAAVH